MWVACLHIPQLAVGCERSRLNLWGIPFVLQTETGMVQVASEEAQAAGIRPGQSLTGAKALCQQLVVLPYDRIAYRNAAQCVWNALAVESSVVEPVSPELCYLELSGSNTPERARRLVSEIAVRARVPVAMGLAVTKLVARQAALLLPAGGVLVVEPGDETALLAPVALENVEEIEPKVRQRLLRLGVTTLGDIHHLPSAELTRQFKQTGWLLRQLAQGEDGQPVRPLWPPRQWKQRIRFDYEVADTAPVHLALRECAARIVTRLRREHEFCRSLELTVGMADSTFTLQGEALATPLDDTDALCGVAFRLLRRVRIEQPVVEVMLVAGELGIGSGRQLALLDEQGRGLPHERRQRLEGTLSYIRRRYGVTAVVPARLLHQARRIHLWTASLTRSVHHDPVEMVVDRHGFPVRFYRRGARYAVRQVQDRWYMTEWVWDEVVNTTAFRVETEPPGFYEIHHCGLEWRVNAVAD